MSAVSRAEAVRDLAATARWHVRHAVPGRDPLEAARALRDLENGDLVAARDRDVCPGWGARVALVLRAAGEPLNQSDDRR